jgi:hypothetical protein
MKPKHDKITRSRSCILLHAIPHTSPSMWVTNNPQHQLFRQATHKLHGPRYHHHHSWLPPRLTTKSQKGTARYNNNVMHAKSLKLGQSTTLYQSRDTFTKAIQGLDQKKFINNLIFVSLAFMFLPKDNMRRYNLQSIVKNLGLHHRV